MLLSNLWRFPITSWHRWWALCIGDDTDIVAGSQWRYNESVKLGCPPRNGKVVTSFLFKSHVKAQNSASLQSQGHFHSAHSSLAAPTLYIAMYCQPEAFGKNIHHYDIAEDVKIYHEMTERIQFSVQIHFSWQWLMINIRTIKSTIRIDNGWGLVEMEIGLEVLKSGSSESKYWAPKIQESGQLKIRDHDDWGSVLLKCWGAEVLRSDSRITPFFLLQMLKWRRLSHWVRLREAIVQKIPEFYEILS